MESLDWSNAQVISLTDTATGLPSREDTKVQACWNTDHLFIRFVCEDAHVVSDYVKRDDPLYEQDVVEVFIDEDGTGKEYLELEVSPNNIVFDAIIQNDGHQSIVGSDKSWEFRGLHTSVARDDADQLVYFIQIPSTNFKKPLQIGLQWKVNFYRIDECVQGIREYQAWQPTRAINYHIPSKFGTMLFI
ncbi:carbohydrate-binding family 9-like protein [Paenibacillus sp. CMAA1364]